MNTKLKRVAVAALCLVVLVAAAACGGGTVTPPPAANNNAATPAAPAAPATPAEPAASEGSTRDFVEVPDGPWNTPFAQTVNITGVKSQGNDMVFEGTDSEFENPWTRAWLNDLNIEVTYDWVDIGGQQYDTRINMAIASNTLPDVFKSNYIQYRQMRAADLLLDIGDAFRNYSSQRLRDYEVEDPTTRLITSEGNAIYALPNYYYGQIDAPKWLWVRKDWYEEAGSPELKTVAEFETLAKQFVSEGKGSYGLAIDNKLRYIFMTGPMFNVFLGDPDNAGRPNFWYKDSTGRIKADITHPEMKVALENWARWYREGIISPDFANFDESKMNEDIVNSRVGFQPFWQWQGWMNGPNLVGATGNNDAYMIPLNFPTLDGSQVIGQVDFPNTQVIAVNKNCNNPAAVMKLMSHVDYIMFDPNTVLTEEEFRGFTDGQREHAPSPFNSIDPRADMLQYLHVSEAMRTGDESKLFTAGMQKKYGDSVAWRDNQEPGGLGAYLQQGRLNGSSYYLSAILLDNNFIQRTDMWGPPPEEFDATANTVDIFTQGFTQIIMGARPLDDYDAVIADWYAAGGQIMEDAVNKHFG